MQARWAWTPRKRLEGHTSVIEGCVGGWESEHGEQLRGRWLRYRRADYMSTRCCTVITWSLKQQSWVGQHLTCRLDSRAEVLLIVCIGVPVSCMIFSEVEVVMVNFGEKLPK